MGSRGCATRKRRASWPVKAMNTKRYAAAVRAFLETNRVKACCHSPADAEAFFSWSACECCGSGLGGSRETYRFACEPQGAAEPQTFETDICADCVEFLAYGSLGETAAEVQP